MKTEVMGMEGVARAAELIRAGGLVAFPTETVYGLGGNALNPSASAKIYAAKGRPSDNPLIVHVGDIAQVQPLVSVLGEDARRLMEAFWPGPLTIVLPKSELVPLETTGGLQTVAVRMPENACALALINESGVPIAAPSANTSGKPSPTEAEHVLHDLDGKIEMILDGGPVGIGVESTIIDVTGRTPVLLRPGAVTLEELSEVLGRQVQIDPAILAGGVAANVAPKAPGMKYRHYAPNAKMYLVGQPSQLQGNNGDRICGAAEGDSAKGQMAAVGCASAAEENAPDQPRRRQAGKIVEEAEKALAAGKRVGVLCCEETRALYQPLFHGGAEPSGKQLDIKVLGSCSDPLSMTHNLFRLLREFDEDGTELIFAESYPDHGVGFALMNRMRKAAGGNVIAV